MVLSEAVQDYLQYARHELGHSPTTHLSYQSWLRNFARWLADQGSPDPPIQEISASQIRRYSYPLSDLRAVAGSPGPPDQRRGGGRGTDRLGQRRPGRRLFLC